MVVEEIMSANPIVIFVHESVDEAERRMFEENIHHLPVIDDEKNLIGIVSDRDLRSYLPNVDEALAYPDNARARRERPISEIMQGEPITVDSDTDIDEARELILDNKIGSLPVLKPDSGALIGIITKHDFVRAAKYE